MSVPMTEMDLKTRALLSEAAEWRLVSLLFECPADGWREQINALAAEVTDAGLKAAAAACDEASVGLYHTTLGPGGPAAPREVSYREGVLPGPWLADGLATSGIGYLVLAAEGLRSRVGPPPPAVVPPSVSGDEGGDLP